MKGVVFLSGAFLAALILILAFRALRTDSSSRVEKWALLLSSLGISALGVLSLLSPSI